jgi:hypothetical protein
VHAANDELAPRHQRVHVPALHHTDVVIGVAAPEHGLGQCEIIGIGDLEVLRAASHQQRPVAQRLHGAGLVGDGIARLCQRLQHADAKHLRRLRQPLAAAVHRGADTAIPIRS